MKSAFFCFCFCSAARTCDPEVVAAVVVVVVAGGGGGGATGHQRAPRSHPAR